MSTTPATAALDAADVAYRVHRFEHDAAATSYGEAAAHALGVDPARVLKTLVVDTGDGLAVAVLAVTATLDLKRVARALGVKRVVMADPERAERATGYVVGGISPFGQRRPLDTVVDASARACASVYVSAGRRGLEVEIAPADLVAATRGRFAEVARPD